ncbi:PTS sugar transporter subunit IIB [Infirmifilum sp. NZ]|uniref:PTS sugar transporter subunit IIB n=1 Tax=Infirmifilum sp. NZ TaxID=2926850 RepID=UPI0027984D6C|nr:PTS sugar transporter subunit IIB [Infirmifilum sp. NZ]UNQ73219.1 PTS sugar transporter subunit IIB [Infirmifilum sp. NZ]
MKIAAVCGMGMGTVFLIKMNVEEVLRELNVPAEVIATNISSLSIGHDTDIIVASVDFEKLLTDKPVRKVFLKNLLDKNELRAKLSVVLKEMGYLKT